MNTPPIWQIYNLPQPTGNYEQSAPVQVTPTMPTQAIPSIGAGAINSPDMSHSMGGDMGGEGDMSQGSSLPSAPHKVGTALKAFLLGPAGLGLTGPDTSKKDDQAKSNPSFVRSVGQNLINQY